MNPAILLEQLRAQYTALRAALLDVGAQARIPTCPDWNSADLFRHLGRVYGWIPPQLGRADGAPDLSSMATAPTDFDELVAWTDEQLDHLLRSFAEHGPDAPALPLLPDVPTTAGTWIRRMAHETAIHRLDAEHTRAGGTEVPGLLFDPAFAADGIDELLAFLVPLPHPAKDALNASGTVLVHAADAGRAWSVRLMPGQAPECAPATGTEQPDATVAGTADAVFRAVWKRPSNAIRSGATELLASVPTP